LRWIALVGGIALVGLAFAAATRVADTREGLVAEAVTLLAGLAGVSLLIYGLAARPRPAGPQTPANAARATRAQPGRRTGRDLLLGAGGVVLALVLMTGLGVSGGALWAGFGLALLLPMLAGSIYLCIRYFRSEP
jgi:hypothetical protein